MPITKSAKKALKQSLRRREQNLKYRKKIKDLAKEVRKLMTEKKIEEAKKLMPQIYQALDKAAKKSIIEDNTAARKKSRLSKMVNQLTK